MSENTPFSIQNPPFDTEELRRKLTEFLNKKVPFENYSEPITIGSVRWGVYAFFDYDNEPIYIGQTNESLRTRIRRHLTNQRTDAVAMSVLDPFEVHTVTVWPLPDYETITKRSGPDFLAAKSFLDSLEYSVYTTCLKQSIFGAVLNEKDPPVSDLIDDLPKSFSGIIVSEDVMKLRSHPDIRIARRAQTLARLAQIISERKVQPGLRRVLNVQAQRLKWLSEKRLEMLTAP